MGETKGNNNSNHNNRKTSDNFLSQVVIRHLPPTMTAEQFKNEIAPVPDHNYFHFLKADLSLGQWAFTRACLNFTKKDDIFVFKDKFDGYVFVDANGTEYPAIVEFSPYQKVPRRRMNSKGEPLSCKKRDPKCGTIEEDPDYKTFIETMNDSNNQKNLPSAEVYLEEIEAREKELKANHGVIRVTTPLIEFIKQKKAEKLRLKEERREERRRQQMEQKRSREDDSKKDDKSANSLQFKVKQRDRKNKAKEGNITVAKNEKREKEKEKNKDKEKEKEKEKKKPKEKGENKQGEKDKDRPPERSEKERERKRERNRRKGRDGGGGGGGGGNTDDKIKPGPANNEKDSQEGVSSAEKQVKKEKNLDKNRYFVVSYSGDKGNNGSNRKSDSGNNKQSSVSKMDTGQNGEDKANRKESETSEGQSSPNQLETSNRSTKDNKKSDNQRVRNKDRPAIEIYRPRRARNQSNSNGTSESADHHDPENNNTSKPERNIRKTKVFTRSRNTD